MRSALASRCLPTCRPSRARMRSPPPMRSASRSSTSSSTTPALRGIQDNIVVSAIAPGAFASDMNRDARDHGTEVAARVPAGRIGQDEDMAGAAIYLASRAGDYVVGATLVVDGGVSFAR